MITVVLYHTEIWLLGDRCKVLATRMPYNVEPVNACCSLHHRSHLQAILMTSFFFLFFVAIFLPITLNVRILRKRKSDHLNFENRLERIHLMRSVCIEHWSSTLNVAESQLMFKCESDRSQQQNKYDFGLMLMKISKTRNSLRMCVQKYYNTALDSLLRDQCVT